MGRWLEGSACDGGGSFKNITTVTDYPSGFASHIRNKRDNLFESTPLFAPHELSAARSPSGEYSRVAREG